MAKKKSAGLPIKFRDWKEFGPFVKAEDEFYDDMLNKLDLKISEPKR